MLADPVRRHGHDRIGFLEFPVRVLLCYGIADGGVRFHTATRRRHHDQAVFAPSEYVRHLRAKIAFLLIRESFGCSGYP